VKGASTWLTALPLTEHGFALHNSACELCVEPDLWPVTSDRLNGASVNSQDGARLNVSANGVWDGRFQKTYFDVRVINPLAPSNRNKALAAVCRKQELEKKQAYQHRIQEVESRGPLGG